MPRRGPAEDTWEDDDGDEGDWDEDDSFDDEPTDDASDEGDDEESTIACPECHEPIHEESERCPYCGHYLSKEDGKSEPKPWWVVLGAILALATVGAWFLF